MNLFSALLPVLLPALPALAAPVTVRGLLMSLADQERIAGARVSLWPVSTRYAAGLREVRGEERAGPAAAAVSEADGSFALTAPAPGLWEVKVEAAGFVPVRRRAVPLFEDTFLPPARLAADAGCRVRVLGPDGRPVAGARVRGRDPETAPGLVAIWERAERQTVTDRGGEARLPRADFESLSLHVLAPGLPPWNGTVRGHETARLSPGLRRTVEVRSHADRPVAGAVVRDLDDGFVLGLTGAAGRLALDLPSGPSGDTALEVETADGRRGAFHWRAATDAAPARVLRLPPPAPLAGQVLDRESRLPLAGALVWPASDPGRAVQADGRGAFHWRAVREDERIDASSPGHLSSFARRTGKVSLPISLEPSFTLSGAVVDEAGRPVAGAEVWVDSFYGAGDPESHRRTESSGEFRFSGLARRALYLVRAAHPGLALSALKVETPPAGPLLPIRLVLPRGRTACGRIEDETGRPVAGARVLMTLIESADAGLQPSQDIPHRAVSGPDGRFALSSLPAGWFSLSVEGEGLVSLNRRGIAVPAGAATADLGRFRLAGEPTLTGRVTDSGGRPVAGAEIWRVQPGEQIPPLLTREPDVVTGPDGGFAIGWPAGETGAGRLDVCRRGLQPVVLQVAGRPKEPVQVVLAPQEREASLAGRVLAPSGSPVAGARVTLNALLDGQSSHCLPDTLRSETGEDGSFSFPDLPPGYWLVGAGATGYLESSEEMQKLGAGERRGGLEIVLRPAATVTGRVLSASGDPVEGAYVQTNSGFSFPRTAADGIYRLEGVKPGEAQISAQGHGDSKAYETLTVQPGENRLDLTLSPETKSREVRGRVLGPDGSPVPGAWVRLYTYQINVMVYAETYTQADGSFQVSTRGDGGKIWAEREGYFCDPVDLDGDSFELRLERAGAVTGRLLNLDPEEKPVFVIASADSPEDKARVTADAFDRLRTFAEKSFSGFVDTQGSYRIPFLPPGAWRVEVTAGSRRAEGRVVLEPGETEVVLDLTLSPPEPKP